MNLLKHNQIFLWICSLAFFFGSANIYAAKKNSVIKLKDGLGKSSRDIFELGAEIRSLEKKLGNKNEQYLTHLEKIKKLDSFIHRIREKIEENKSQLDLEVEKTKLAFEQLLLNELQPQSEEHLLKQKILKKILLSEMETLQKYENKNRKLLSMLNTYEDQLFEMKQNEKSVYELIVNLENEKKNLSQNYLNKVAIKNELEQKLEMELARERAYKANQRSQKVSTNFPVQLGKPLLDYVKVKNSKKGVTFTYEGVKPVLASASGEVVYSGVLSTYGNVIILDHGNDIRSVLLGDIVVKVQKGTRLGKGDLIGYTNSDTGITKSLYYELRKKNIAQNTYKILKANKVL